MPRIAILAAMVVSAGGCGDSVRFYFRDSISRAPVNGEISIEQAIYFADLLAPVRNQKIVVVNGEAATRIDLDRSWRVTLVHNGATASWGINLPSPDDLARPLGEWMPGARNIEARMLTSDPPP